MEKPVQGAESYEGPEFDYLYDDALDHLVVLRFEYELIESDGLIDRPVTVHDAPGTHGLHVVYQNSHGFVGAQSSLVGVPREGIDNVVYILLQLRRRYADYPLSLCHHVHYRVLLSTKGLKRSYINLIHTHAGVG